VSKPCKPASKKSRVAAQRSRQSLESSEDKAKKGLSSSKREDIWALIIAGAIMLVSMAAPEGVHNLFTEFLYLF